jgi:hypothetical protein
VIAVAVPIAVPVMVAIALPEYAPITIAIVIIIAAEAARLAEAIVAESATHALDLLDDAQLILRQSSIGRAREADRIGTLGQQRRPEDGCGGQRDKQELAHFRTSSFFCGQSLDRILQSRKCTRLNDLDSFRGRNQIAGTSL